MLRNQLYRETIPRYLEKLDSPEGGFGTASKTGSLNAVRADGAIVAGNTGPMVLSIFTYDNLERVGQWIMKGKWRSQGWRRRLVQTWSPEGSMAKLWCQIGTFGRGFRRRPRVV